MFWDRIIGGILGLLLAFSAGGELQFWLDEGKVRYRPKHGATRLLSYDETPFSYVGQYSSGSSLSGRRSMAIGRTVPARIGRMSEAISRIALPICQSIFS